MHDQVVGKDRQIGLSGKARRKIAQLQIQHHSTMRADRVLVWGDRFIVLICAVRGANTADQPCLAQGMQIIVYSRKHHTGIFLPHASKDLIWL